MKKSGSTEGQSASELIDKSSAELGDWRGETLSRMRKLIKDADPDVVEEWKWRKPSHPGVPVWSHGGLICTGESFKSIYRFVRLAGADETPVRPHRNPWMRRLSPLPLLDDVRVRVFDELAHPAQGLTAPVSELGAAFVNQLRCRLTLGRTRLFHVLLLKVPDSS